ncbi:hypothetical protein [Xanthomonas vesicatoria]|uniref:Uncharacterized protein n=1 Tax=Xanthomonas vesicatoria ATCC 35937 TaxID=925775 RepID=F0BKU4_9XANT|nr:hypothetical protein [Xanthomonas vesicatoria]APP76013.1 hypothetical protein BJD12_13120 [Xanthomonas vesicatoria ATCC 35937]EGD06902.1 hypothetical protein XVE_4911 [Xanthomonas vesicatoria ATCC 35937]KTF30010.1 hypothetical protein LMG920_20700 [Xanthomonas vesicatoria]KTF35055.1 hypothetical protein LMG919_14080 [Xanthomonas vesicatoria]MCC8559312.1 hypothetical protein [Xanthomonas vesicatoria]
MIVVDQAVADWFLLRDGSDAYWLDVNCNSSATGFSILLQLNDTELPHVLADRYAGCAQLAAQIQARPHAYAVRDHSALHGSRVLAAVQAWRAAAGAAAA